MMTTVASELRVAIYQYEARSPGKGGAESPRDRLHRLAETLEQVGQGGVDLLVCPELFLSGYNVGERVALLSESSDGPFAAQVAKLAAQWEIAILYGYPEQDGQHRYNSALCIGKDGNQLANHRKLVLPSDFERRWFTTGQALTLFDFSGWKIAILICYDVEFPEAVRACAKAGADLVLVPTALKDKWGVVAHRVVPARAFENGVFLVYANYAGQEGEWRYLGNSCVVSPTGEDIVRGSQEEQLLSAILQPNQLNKARRTLPYLKDLETLQILG
ncbi:MAG: carbon-nitrogen hydrolase family protein [Ardenticatenaceae bacterium]